MYQAKISQTVLKLSISAVLVLGVFVLPKAVSAATVNLTPTPVAIGQNQQFSVNIQVGSAVDLFGAAFDLGYNPALIQFVSATQGPFLVSDGASAITMASASTPGNLVFGATRLGVPTGVTGSGNLAVLTFKSLTADGSTNLVFSKNSLEAYSGALLTAAWQNGQVNISTPDTTAPSTPANVTATAVSASQINLAWSASTDARGVTGYRIYRNNILLATVTGTSYQNTGLPASTAYSYQVSAIDAAGNESVRSATVSATTQQAPDTTAPSTPANVSATAVSASQINLAWSASTDARGVTGYRIYKNNVLLTTVTGTSYQNTGLTAGITYSYAVSAIDAAGNASAQSTAVSATTQKNPDATAPSIPTGLAASVISTSQINLVWNASTDPTVTGAITSGVANYKIYRNNILLTTAIGTSYQNIGLSASTAYSYQVSAIDAAGNESARSVTVSATTQSIQDTSAPSVPTNVITSSVTSNRIDIAWTASTDNVAVTGYKVYRDNIYMMTVTGATYYNANLPAETTYSYQISAIDAAGNESVRSVSVSATTLAAPDTTDPSVPANVRVTSVTADRIEIAWDASTDDRGVTGYKVYRNSTYMMTVIGTTYYNAGLASGATYSYQVSAIDAAGNESARSTTVSATTLKPADTTAPTVPTNLYARYNLYYYPMDVKLYWGASKDNVYGTVTYKIYRNTELIGVTTWRSFTNKLSSYGSYAYYVIAVDKAGNESDGSNIVNINYLPDTTAPTAPANLIVRYDAYRYPKDVKLYWTGSRDERPGRIVYEIFRNGAIIASTTRTAYYDKLDSYGTYIYNIKARDIAGNESVASNEVNVICAPDTTAPLTTASFKAYQSTYDKTTVRLGWYGVRDERPGYVKYNIYKDDVRIATTNYTYFTDKLTAKGTYEYQVSSVDIAGNESARTDAKAATL